MTLVKLPALVCVLFVFCVCWFCFSHFPLPHNFIQPLAVQESGIVSSHSARSSSTIIVMDHGKPQRQEAEAEAEEVFGFSSLSMASQADNGENGHGFPSDAGVSGGGTSFPRVVSSSSTTSSASATSCTTHNHDFGSDAESGISSLSSRSVRPDQGEMFLPTKQEVRMQCSLLSTACLFLRNAMPCCFGRYLGSSLTH